MIGGWKATRVVAITTALVRQLGEDRALEYAKSLHSGDWLVMGPRGGHYIADAGQETVWRLDRSHFFEGPGQWRFLGHRKSVRYVKPSNGIIGRLKEGS